MVRPLFDRETGRLVLSTTKKPTKDKTIRLVLFLGTVGT